MNTKLKISDEADTWQKIDSLLKNKIPSQFYSAFFADLLPFFEDVDTLVLTAQDEKVLNHVKKCYKNIIFEAARSLNPSLKVKFQKNKDFLERSQRNNRKNLNKNDERQAVLFDGEENQSSTVGHSRSLTSSQRVAKANHLHEKINGRVREKIGEKKIDFNGKIELNPNYSFERFIKGPSNEHALAAALGAAQNPTSFNNPLYLYGGVSRGKTHLMMAIGNYILQNFPWMRVVYATSENLQSDLVEAFKTNRLSHFNAKYRDLDVLLIDDIQFISPNAVQTQEAIFNAFNYLYQKGKRIVISGDCPPQKLSMLTDRLKSRFQSGLIIDIKEPNLETRLAIINAKAEEMNLNISFDVLKFIVLSLPKQIRVLESALIKLKFISELENKPIDRPLVKLALADIGELASMHEIGVEDILTTVCIKFQVAREDILGSSRISRIVTARQAAMSLSRKFVPAMSLAAVANFFGKSDHTTVMNAERKIKDLLDKDMAFAALYTEVIENLKSGI